MWDQGPEPDNFWHVINADQSRPDDNDVMPSQSGRICCDSAPPHPNLQYFLVAEVGVLVVALQINCCNEHVRCLSLDQAPDLYTIE